MFTYKVTFGLNGKVDNMFVQADDSMEAFSKVLRAFPGARMFGCTATRPTSVLSSEVKQSIHEFANLEKVVVAPPGTYTREALVKDVKTVQEVATRIIKNNVIRVDFVGKKRAS